MNYLKTVAEAGVKNMEMEALVFGALTHMAGIRSAVVCVTLLDRLKGDQITDITVTVILHPLPHALRAVRVWLDKNK